MNRLKQFRVLRIGATLTTLVTLLLVTSGLAAGAGYHVIKTYKLGGDGGWDYLTVDPASNRLYISRSTHVIVIDAEGNSIPFLKGLEDGSPRRAWVSRQ